MLNLKKIAAGGTIAGALALSALGLSTGVANADDWGYGPGYGWNGGPGYYAPTYGYGPGYGYGGGGACAFIPPIVSQWVPPALCGG